MNEFQKLKIREQQRELDRAKAEKPFAHVQDGKGWWLWFDYPDENGGREQVKVPIISFVFEGSHEDFFPSAAYYWCSMEKRIEVVCFDSFGRPNDNDLKEIYYGGKK